MIDLDVYLATVRDLLAGKDIYATRTPYWNLPFIYPPIAALLLVPLAYLPLWGVQVLWAGLTVLAQRLILVRAGVRRSSAIALANVALVLAFEPFRTTLGYGQVNTLLMATMYVYFRDIAHIWDVLQQLIFYGMPIIYPLTYVTNRGGLLADIARLELINPFAQAIQDIRHNFIAPDTQPTIWNQFNNWGVRLLPLILTVVLLWLGITLFRRNSRKFAEVM